SRRSAGYERVSARHIRPQRRHARLAEVLGEKAWRPLNTAHPQVIQAKCVPHKPVDYVKPLVRIVLIQAYLDVLWRVAGKIKQRVPFDVEDPVGRGTRN